MGGFPAGGLLTWGEFLTSVGFRRARRLCFSRALSVVRMIESTQRIARGADGHAMSQPRRIVPGSFYMVTRRIAQRMFLLRPSDEINAILEYCLAEAADRFNVKVIAFMVMSNHYHAVVYDPDAKLPAFIERFHKMVSKAVNRHHKRWENLWSTEETCVTHLVTLDDVFDKVVYVLMNPVSAHLVETVAQWPGSSSWLRMGRAATVKRPQVYFRKKGSVMPATAKLVVTTPPGLKGETSAEWIKRVRREVHLREEVARKERTAKRTKLLGRKCVLATSPFAAPTTAAPHRRLRPALACKDRERMKRERAILKSFRATYRTMLALLVKRLRKGDLEGEPLVEFPAGTWRWRALGVRCARPRPAA